MSSAIPREQLFDGPRILDDRRHEQRDHRVDVRVGEDRAASVRSYVAALAEPSRSTGFARLASFGVLLGQRGPGLRRSVPAATRPCAFAGVGAEDAETAGVGDDRDAVACGRAAAWSAARRCRAAPAASIARKHAGLAEERVDDGVGARQRGRVRGRRARAGVARAASHREDRLRACDPACDARELARVAEGLEVEQDDVGLGIVLPVLEQVVRRDVGLVADRDERRQTEPARVCLLEQREPERAALGRERDAAGRERPARERRVQAARRRSDAEAVRADQAGAVATDEREQLLLRARAPRSRFRRSRPR